MKKLTALVAGGLGYVLGARAGRQRYEQIRRMAMQVRNNPKVQETAQKAADTAKEAAPVLKEKVTGGGSDSGSESTQSSSPSGVPLEDSAYPPSSPTV